MLRIPETSMPIQSQPEDLNSSRRNQPTRLEESNYNSSLMKILADVLKTIMSSNQRCLAEQANNRIEESNRDFIDDRESNRQNNKRSSRQKNKRPAQITRTIRAAQVAALTAKNYELEVRDREVIVEPPAMSEEQTRKSELKKWASKVLKNVASASFHYCSKNEMTFEQAKVYCSENILKNLALLGSSKALTSQDFEVIDNHIQGKGIKYIMTKYPKTDSKDLNKKLSSQIKEVNNIQALQNNYIDNSKVSFQYRSDGNYNDLIMRFINEVTKLVDDPSGEKKGDNEGEKKGDKEEEKQTNYQYFKDYMSNIFQRVESEDWVVNRQYKRKSKDVEDEMQERDEEINQDSFDTESQVGCCRHNQVHQRGQYNGNCMDKYFNKQANNEKIKKKMEYMEKVKQYTSYLIGRKIPESFTKYTDDEIKSKNMIIKSPEVLRILTKWCEELMRPFQNDNYYTDRSEGMKLQTEDALSVPDRQKRKIIDRLLRLEKEDILKDKEELLKHNYKMQANFLEYELEKAEKGEGDEHVDLLQKISGKFSIKTVNNLHSYIILLLNRLIHGLMQVARRDYTSKKQTHFDYSPCPINLLAFRVGDLMRCKFSSHQEQVFLIFKELQRRSKRQPNKLRIIRIKNRLGTGNNDILINVKFNNKVTCEIQLAVNAKTDSFLKTSTLFNHYFYELQRSAFGPLTQLCSIWKSQDQKSSIYQQLINAQNLSKNPKKHTCQGKQQRYEMEQYERPFICGQCNCTYFHNNYICSHFCCSQCGFFQCFKCRLSHQTDQNLISSYITDKKLRELTKKRVKYPDQLPELGVCIYLEQKQPKMTIFTYFIDQSGKKYIFAKKKVGETIQIEKIAMITSKKQLQAFMSKYIVFQLKVSEDLTIDKDDIEKKYFLRKLIQNNYKEQKESLLLMNLSLDTPKCKQLLDIGKEKEKWKVKNLFLEDNKDLDEICFESKEFPNLNWLTISGNFKNFSKLGTFKNLTTFRANKCNLKSIPNEFFELQNIQRLDFSNNKIQKIPDAIRKLKKLRRLQIMYNDPLIQLSQGLCECTNLQYVTINTCQNLEKLPQNIDKLKKLQTLVCNHTSIGELPQSIKNLKALTTLKIFNAPLKEMPDFVFDLNTLTDINFSGTQITLIPVRIEKLENLHTVTFKNCKKITELPPQFMNLRKLKKISFTKSSNLTLPEKIGQLTQLKSFQLSECNLKNLPQSFKDLKHLQKLNLSDNKLTDMDSQLFTNFLELEQLNLQKSGLIQLPNLSKCHKLIKLNLNQNQIKEIPDDYMAKLSNLEDLKIDSNQFTSFPPSILKLDKLMILSAKSNCLQNFNVMDLQQINNSYRSQRFLTKLTEINLKQNPLDKFPSWILKCQNLMKLNLQHTQIEDIPHEIYSLIHLKELAMDYTKIKQLPAKMEKMNLETISFSFCRITKIPYQLRKMSKLKKLAMTHNPIQNYQNLEWILDKNIDCDQKVKIQQSSGQKVIKQIVRINL